MWCSSISGFVVGDTGRGSRNHNHRFLPRAGGTGHPWQEPLAPSSFLRENTGRLARQNIEYQERSMASRMQHAIECPPPSCIRFDCDVQALFEEAHAFTSQTDTTPPRPSKRMHTETGASWILVPPRAISSLDDTTSRCASPARLSHRKTPSQSYIPRPSLQRQPSQTQQIRIHTLHCPQATVHSSLVALP